MRIETTEELRLVIAALELAKERAALDDQSALSSLLVRAREALRERERKEGRLKELSERLAAVAKASAFDTAEFELNAAQRRARERWNRLMAEANALEEELGL